MFEPSAERRALIDTAARIVRDRYDYAARHRLRSDGHDLELARWREFAELGWLATAVSEANGGLGLNHSLLSVLAEALGPAAMSEPFSSQVALPAYVLDHCAPGRLRDEVLDELLGGAGFVALVQDAADNGIGTASALRRRAEGWVLNGHHALVADGGIAARLLALARREEGGGEAVALVCLASATPGVSVLASPTFDGHNVADIRFTDVAVEPAQVLEIAAPGAVIAEAFDLYALLLAAESLGIARALLDLTHDYLAGREQFGQKLAEFQVLQHRLVDMHLAIVRLESTLELARVKCDELGLAGARPFISAAKVQAAAVGRHVGQQAVQLHGGMGMTDELIVGQYYKRLTANELRAGTAAVHLARLAAARGITPS